MTVSREVDADEYAATLSRLRAVQDFDPSVHKPGGIGRVEQWRAPDGRVCAWIHVAYWRGEHDWHYYVEEASPT